MKKIRLILIISIFILFIPVDIKSDDSLFAGQEWYDLIETVEVNRENPSAYFIPYQDSLLALENEKSVFTKDIYKSSFIHSLNGEWKFYYAKSPYDQLSWNDIENWDTSNWDTIKIPSNVQLQFDEEGFKYDTPIYTNMLYPWVNYEKLNLSEYPKAPLKNNNSLILEASIRNLSNEFGGNYKLIADLYNQEDEKVWDFPLEIEYTLDKAITDISLLSKDLGITNSKAKSIDNPILWSDENPYLYRLLINLYDSNNNIVETTCIRFGIREIGINILDNGKQQITINDVPLLIKGVNRHEFDSVKGSAITKEDIINDLIIMKQNNINSLRTSHYPNNVFTYEVADELGIYIMDETNIESHYGAMVDDIPSGYKAWKYSVMDRVKNMVERDKNYTSIIMWSLGNEATYKDYELNNDYNMFLSSSWILERDPSRLRAYERDNRNIGTREGSVVDVFSSQYYSIEEVIEYLKSDNKLPYIQSEYAHSMGNALGNLKEYWDIFRLYENAHGGYIWDFKDQALFIPINFNETQLSNTKNNLNNYYYAYGGDFGERSSYLEFSGNGLLFADGSLSPKMYEVRKVYQSINFKAVNIEKGIFNISNEYSFTNLNQFNVVYKIVNDGKIIEEDNIVIDLEPKLNKDIYIDFDLEQKGLYSSIIFEVKLKNDTNYNMYKNDIIAYEQFDLYKANKITYNLNNEFKEVIEDENNLIIKGNSSYGLFEIIFDKNKGNIKQYKINDEVIFKNGPKLNYFRSPISNDSQYSFNENIESKYALELENTHEAFNIGNINIKNNKNNININVIGNLFDSNKVIINYIIHSDGIISVSNEFKPTNSLNGVIPKVGMEIVLNDEYQNIKYYGRGPFENYPDRNSASIKSIYEDKIENMFSDLYLRPQDNGLRTDVDYVMLSDKDNKGILITGDNLQFSALPYNYKQLNKANHFYELNDSNYIYLNINGNTRGLGNAICGDLPLEKYTISLNKKYSYKYMIIPFNKPLSDEKLIEYSIYN